jgi:hypothetical protein
MRFHVESEFGKKGSTQLPADGDIVAVGIASSSDVDICEVGPYRLGPMSIVPCRGGETVEALRGFRATNLNGSVPSLINQNLVLQLYESCDALVPPGPRAPVMVASGPIFLAGAGLFTLALRVPFSGRKQCVFNVRRVTETAMPADNTAVVRGVTYVDRDTQRTFPTAPEYKEVQAALVLAGGASTLGGIETIQLGRVWYVGGGGDLQEGFDELELWLDGTASLTQSIAHAVASGERG